MVMNSSCWVTEVSSSATEFGLRAGSPGPYRSPRSAPVRTRGRREEIDPTQPAHGL